jgi:radical SAM superfamily enzyme YgiQ (UPF0313 family)
MIDVVFVNTSSALKAYQDLSVNYSAVEPPTWSLLLAESCRNKGFEVAILDCEAEKLTNHTALNRVIQLKPRLIVFVVYGQNPNSGTVNMTGSIELADYFRENNNQIPVAFVGSHTSALPLEVLKIESIDIVILNEGVYAIHNLLRSNLKSDLKKIKGIGYKISNILMLNQPESIVPQELMDVDLPGYAWDLLPFRIKPLDLYRAHFWHANFTQEDRSPFAAIYTSLGCNFSCNFCMINIINRNNNNLSISAADSKGMRFWSTSWVIKELNKLSQMGVKHLRISDEMFFLNKRYYQPLLNEIISQNFQFNMWAYTRVDTVRDDMLELFKKAGVNWLALGIEAGSSFVRKEASKGSFKEINIYEVCKKIKDSNINIIGNYIYGFPEDDISTMQQTLDLALDLNTEMANMYTCQALPGSPLYHDSISNGWIPPEKFEQYGFLSYECIPLNTKYVAARTVLQFRDDAMNKYLTSENYLNLIENKFGITQKQNIIEMSKIKLKRKLLGQ